jgi:D-inositol-3-phosphate glycosyltransferase
MKYPCLQFPPQSPSLRIALISEHASPLAAVGGIDAGGQNIYVAHVSQALVRAGHSVDVFTRRDAPDLPAVVRQRAGLRVVHIPAGPARFVPKEELLQHMPEFFAACRRSCSARRYDLVHANFFMSGWVASELKRSLGLPFAITFHALGLVRLEHQKSADGFPPERVDIERRLVREADCIVAECPQDESDLMRLYHADPDRVVMVPCGCDAGEFWPVDRARARAGLGLANDEFIVLQLGRLVPRKGIDNVIEAIARLPRRMTARLLVVGGASDTPDASLTPEIARLRALACGLGVETRVSFVGRRQRHELHRYYSASDVFVTTPWYEPFGITPLEAMACSTPVIGSAVGGIRYTVVPGVTGHLVPPHDPEALARRLADLHDNPSLARAMGRAGLARVRAMFTWDHVGNQLATAFAQLQATRREQRNVARSRRLDVVAAHPAGVRP